MTEAEYIERLNKLYTYTRESDGKVFKITFYGHWTDIVSEDGETDSVKFAGTESGYESLVSRSKGYGYRRIKNVQ